MRDEAQASFMPFNNMLQAFDIRDINNMRVPYDYGSLMHYHAVAHAKRVSDFTIIPRELKYVTTMGTERMAFLDAKVINDLYCSRSLLLSSDLIGRLSCSRLFRSLLSIPTIALSQRRIPGSERLLQMPLSRRAGRPRLQSITAFV